MFTLSNIINSVEIRRDEYYYEELALRAWCGAHDVDADSLGLRETFRLLDAFCGVFGSPLEFTDQNLHDAQHMMGDDTLSLEELVPYWCAVFTVIRFVEFDGDEFLHKVAVFQPWV